MTMFDQYFARLPDLISTIIFTPYFRIGYTVFSIFIIIALIGYVRKHYFKLTMKGAHFGFVLGVIFVLVGELATVVIALYGYHTLDILSFKKNPQQIMELTRQSVGKFNHVLGATQSSTQKISATSILEELPQLSKQEEDKVKSIICR